MEEISTSSANKKIPFDNLEQALAKVDILITGAGNERIITEEIIKSALSGRKAKPLFIIDGSVPGDVEVGVSRLEDVFLYDLNDLEQIVIDNRFENNIAIGEAKRLIEAEISLILTDINKNNPLSKAQEQFDDLDLEKSKRDVLRRAKVNAKPVAIINDFIKELKKRNLIKKERNN
jgi:glutamyl-tRNA reductase